MLSRNLYKNKKSPLGEKRKKALLASVLAVALFLVFYGIYSFAKMTKSPAKKEEVKIATGDQPLKQSLAVYANADKGLSLRKDRDANSQRLAIIPNGTKLDVQEELNGWYQVSYNNQQGWVSKQYTTQDAPAVDATTSWTTYSNSSGYKIKYPAGWKVQDYGAAAAFQAASVAGFSDTDLPATLPQGSEFFAPITVRVSSLTADQVKNSYASISGATTQAITFGSYPATQYTYTSSSTSTQVNSIVVESGGKVFIFSESGGYLDDLMNMSKTFTIGG